jgi:hypothetical protein
MIIERGINVEQLNTMSESIGELSDEESVDNICGRSYAITRHIHARQRTYPYLSAGVVLTGSGVLTLGNIVEIIPTATNEINTLTITHACDLGGNITIDLDGYVFTIPVVAGDINSVATQLRAFNYTFGCCSWVISGAEAEVIFTKLGLASTAVLGNLGTTGITGSIVKTQTGTGIGKPFDIHGIQLGLMGNQDTYIINLYAGLSGYEERICSRRVTTTQNNQAGGEVLCVTPLIDAGTRISAAVATVNGGNKIATVSLNYHYY